MRERPSRPHATIFAGPNGSGKSTIARVLRPAGELVNADDVATLIDDQQPERASFAAGRIVVKRLSDLISRGQVFAYETTLSSRHSLAVMQKAKSAGYEINLVFVFLQTADLCVKRVEDRTLAGGHSIAESVIRRRYELTFTNLGVGLELADAAVVYDNSDRDAVKEVLRAAARQVIRSALDLRLAAHARVNDAVLRSVSEAKSR